MARDTAVVMCSEDFREFSERETQLECPLCKLDALNSRRRKYPITAVRALRCRQDAEPLIVTESIGTEPVRRASSPERIELALTTSVWTLESVPESSTFLSLPSHLMA